MTVIRGFGPGTRALPVPVKSLNKMFPGVAAAAVVAATVDAAAVDAAAVDAAKAAAAKAAAA